MGDDDTNDTMTSDTTDAPATPAPSDAPAPAAPAASGAPGASSGAATTPGARGGAGAPRLGFAEAFARAFEIAMREEHAEYEAMPPRYAPGEGVVDVVEPNGESHFGGLDPEPTAKR